MDVTPILPVRFQEIVAIPDATRRESFAVAANQTLDGQVVSVDRDTVIVSIGRQRVPAQAAPGTTLRAGEAVRLFVREVDPDQVVMQIVARGSSLQTLRSLTTEDLSAELTGLGITPDQTTLAVARALINRGLPITASNVLDVRGALARLGTSDPQDLDAAVFLKGQGLPLTGDAIQIVRQALQSRSALGAQVEGLRTVLADLAARLAGLGVTPAPRAPPAPTPAAADEALADAFGDSAPGGVTVGTQTATPASPPVPSTAPTSPAPGAGVETEARPATGPAEGGARPGAIPAESPDAAGAAGPPAPGPVATGASPGAAAADIAAEPTATPPAPPGGAPTSSGPAPAPAATADEAGRLIPLPLAEGQGEGSLDRGGALTGFSGTLSQGERDQGAGLVTDAGARPPVTATDETLPPSGTIPSQSAAGDPTATERASSPEPSLPRLLSVVAETLDRLPLFDDAALADGGGELAEGIRRVVADQATPVEAKLARVLEGLASRADLDDLVARDLKTTLHHLVRETQAHLDPRVAERLPPETLRDLQAAGRQAEALLGQVELQQLANVPRPDGQTPNYLVLQLPVSGGREPQTAQIRIRQESDGKTSRIDPKNVHVVFQLELQHLRTVRVGIRVVDRHMSCQLGSSDPAVTDLLARHADELRAGLTGLGYAVDPVKTAVLRAEDLAPPPGAADGPLAPPPRPTMRLDARA
ncbi:MAG TPA: flagellar hook-length control protein FliK [Chloroflexota bacterium]